MGQAKGWGLATIGVIIGMSTSMALAAPSYSFHKIADNTGLFNTFPHGASINDHGIVLFTANFDGGGAGYYTGPDPVLDAAVDPSGYPTSFASRRAEMNNAGTIVFSGNQSGVGVGVFTVSPEATRANASGAYQDFLTPVLNNVGDVAFFAFLDWTPPAPQQYGIFRGADPVADVVGLGAGPTGGVYGTFDDPDINDAGTVVFRSTLTAGGSGIFSGPNPATDTLIDTSGPYSVINGRVSINNDGTVAFRADLDAGGSGIFVGPDPALHTIATNAGDFNVFGDPDINADGVVVFEATLDAGGEGIFTGPNSIADRVIATGDPLFGSTVSTVTFVKGLNELGDIAFAYSLANGERGVAVAQVPEPSLTATVSVVTAILRCRRRRA